MAANSSLNTFVDPYPGELFYSVLARNYRHFGFSSPSSFNRAFLGRDDIDYDFIYMNGVSHFSEISNHYTTDELVLRHFPAPALFPFMREESRESFRKATVQARDNAKNHLLKAIGPNSKKGLFYCPLCAKEDLDSCGEAYLHTNHYYPGLDICPVHNVKLKKVRTAADIFRQPSFLRAEDLDLETFDSARDFEIKLSVFYERFIENPPGPELIKEKILKALKAKGYMKGTRLESGRLLEELLCFYGRDFLTDAGFPAEEGVFKKKILGILKAKDVPAFPALILILFLFDSPESFYCAPVLETEDTEASYGETVCINPVCRDFGYDRNMVLTEVNQHGRRLGVGCRTCGQFYWKNLETGTIRITDRGCLWENTLHELLEEGKSIREAAEILDILPSNLRTYLKKKPVSHSDRIKRARDRLLEFQEENGNAKGFSRKHAQDYFYLIHFDREWYEKHRIEGGTIKERPWRKNYFDEDLALLPRLESSYDYLSGEYPCVKISQKSLLAHSGISRIPNNFGEYSGCREFIKSVKESTEDYYVRYGIAAANHLKEEGFTEITRGMLAREMNDKRRLYEPEIWSKIESAL